VHDDGGRYRPGDSFGAPGRADGALPGSQYATFGPRGGYPGRLSDPAGSRPGTGADRGGPAPAQARPYGRIQIFTVLDDRVADFDRLAEETAEQVSAGEPDTLVFVIHLVPSAPMQRIFYEIYRDRAAFDSHENQPYMQRFAAERRSLVLATNVIDLRLKYAKVAPLPNPQQAAQAMPVMPAAPPSASPPPPRPQRSDQPQRPGQAPRPDQPRPDQPRRPEPEGPGYDQERRERYEPRRPDPRTEPRPDPRQEPRQVPSGRPYGG
jgi:quinol monooxygenase YgiN